jgi:hypothetical protein
MPQGQGRRFWLPVIAFAKVSLDGFSGFEEPDYAKTVSSVSVRRLVAGERVEQRAGRAAA